MNIAPFVPKAGTVFQWMPMESLPVLQKRISLSVTANWRTRGFRSRMSLNWGEIQSILSRGDGNLAKVLADIEKESLPAWRQAVSKHQLEFDYFAHQKWNVSQKLPWDILDSGSNVEKLKGMN